MRDDAAIFKWTAVFVGVIIVCFGLGYFVLGPRAQTSSSSGGLIIEETKPGTVAVVNRPAASPEPDMSVVERTDEIEAKRKKKEEEARKKKAEEAKKEEEEEKKKKEEEEKKKAEEEAKATPTPSPTPSPTPDTGVPVSPEGSAITTPEPVTTPTPAPVPEVPRVTSDLYRVRVGSFANRDNAQNLAAELNGRGYSTTIIRDEGGSSTTYRLQVGAYRDKKTADNTLKELKANGYDAVISRS